MMSSRFGYRGFYKGKYTGKKFYGGISKKKFVKKPYVPSWKYKAAVLPMVKEQKHVDISVVGPTATIACAGATVPNQNLSTGYLCCNLVQQGPSEVNRDGKIVIGKHLGLRFGLQCGANTETSDAVVRYMVVMVRQNISTMALSNWLSILTETGGTATTFNSGVYPTQMPAVTVMHQNQVTISKVSGPSPIHNVSISLPLKKLPTAYVLSSNPMTFADVGSNAIYFVIFSRMTGAGTLPVITDFICRYTFQDNN